MLILASFTAFIVDEGCHVVNDRSARRGVLGIGCLEHFADGMKHLVDALGSDGVDEIDEATVGHGVQQLAAGSLKLLVVDNVGNGSFHELEDGLDRDSQGGVVVEIKQGEIDVAAGEHELKQAAVGRQGSEGLWFVSRRQSSRKQIAAK